MGINARERTASARAARRAVTRFVHLFGASNVGEMR